eukprot:7383309-Alexandrium_andersonii.AAC.1
MCRCQPSRVSQALPSPATGGGLLGRGSGLPLSPIGGVAVVSVVVVVLVLVLVMVVVVVV